MRGTATAARERRLRSKLTGGLAKDSGAGTATNTHNREFAAEVDHESAQRPAEKSRAAAVRSQQSSVDCSVRIRVSDACSARGSRKVELHRSCPANPCLQLLHVTASSDGRSAAIAMGRGDCSGRSENESGLPQHAIGCVCVCALARRRRWKHG